MLLSPAAMHIPDGFLSPPVALVLWLFSAAAIAAALRRNELADDERKLPLMGVLAAAIFAAQMLNFTVAGGTSGHMLGAALAAILLGPWTAVLVMTSVVAVQALIFQDGGLLALGGNLFNMAVVGVFVAYTVYALISRLTRGRMSGKILGGAIAAWFSVEFSALGVGMQLALSGTSPANIAIPAMAAVHALIGIGEGLITTGALTFLAAARPDLLLGSSAGRRSNVPVWISGSVLTLGLIVLSTLASTHPDGLEWVAQSHGFISRVRGPLFTLLPNYEIPGLRSQALAAVLAGLLGAVLVAGTIFVMARYRKKDRA